MEDENLRVEISKEDIVKEYIEDNGSDPTWKDKKQKEMEKEEKNEYKKYRKRFEKKNKQKNKEIPENKPNKQTKKELPEEFYEKNENNVTEEELWKLIINTGKKIREDLLTPEQKVELKKNRKEIEFIESYIKHNDLETQEKLNYAIEHDEKFRIFLEKTERLDLLYTGKHLENMKREKQEVIKQCEEDAKKDKGNRIARKFAKKKKLSNVFEESKKDLDLTPYKNKKLESQGSILVMYLRKNSLAQLRYVKMDEVGQIKVDGYVYHERDAIYRFGKKNDPLLVIMEGALVPINKATLKENLGCETAEAQKLMIKGIEQAEVVKSSGVDENAKKPFAPPKWMIIVGIAIAIGIYMFVGGAS